MNKPQVVYIIIFIILALLECIKLSQSYCDHEGLIKCFLYIHKIYRNKGDFDVVILY
jgi:hypothetical protein